MSDKVTQWLDGLGLGQYAEAFAKQEVVYDDLVELNEDDLKELGIPLGPRKRFLKGAAALAESQPAAVSIDPIALEPDEHLAAWERHPGERKPVTMLFADITDSTALTEELDAEETHDLLYGATQRMCEAIENNRGTVCRFMGDGVMAMFGAPMASEHHAVAACQAALDMHSSIHEYARELERKHGEALKIRVGLHSGEVVVLSVGEGDKLEYDASGPAVPIAARMEQAARPGETYMTAATHQLGEPRIEADSLEAISVKGISDPIPVFALRRLRSFEEGVAQMVQTAFVGRRAELIQFTGVLDACLAEGHGQAIYIRGDPGIGKTRLVEEFARIARVQGVACHRALVLDFGIGKGQDAIRALVRSLLSIPLGSGKSQRQQAADKVFDSDRLEAQQKVHLNDLLDLPQSIEQRSLYDAMTNEARNQGKQEVVAALVRSFSNETPIVNIVEDVHWADRIVLDHLLNLTKTVADCPALLVMTSRIEGDQLNQEWKSGTEGSPFLTMDLGPLRPDESMILITRFMDLSDTLASRCIERAAGNPLFLEQLLRSAAEGEVDELPDSIQSLVLSRLDHLDSWDKRALQAASVIGPRFSLDALRYVMASNEYHCADLIEHSLVRPDGDDYLFTHALIRDGVYASLIRSRKNSLHIRAADCFRESDAVLHAQHLDRAEDPRAPRAYLEASRSQWEQYRTQQALKLARRGLELAQTDVDRFDLKCQQGELQQHIGSTDDAMASYQEALQLAKNDGQRCLAQLGLAGNMRLLDQHAAALEMLDEAETAAVQSERAETRARIHHLRGNLYFGLGRGDDCLEQHQLALAHARASGSPELEASALGGIGDALYAQGRMRSAHDYISKCLSVSRKHGFGRIEVANWVMIAGGGSLQYLNKLEEALAESFAVLKATQAVHHQRAEINAHHNVVAAAYCLGKIELSRDHAEKALAVGRQLGTRRFWARSIHHIGRADLRQGKNKEAISALEEALAIMRETGIRLWGPCILGTLALATDVPTVRDKALAEGEQLLRSGCLGHNYFEFYQEGIEACFRVGDWVGVEKYASALEEFTQPEPLPYTDFVIARGRVLAAHGSGQRSNETARELERLREQALRVDFRIALPALEEALATV